ncbi:hypothetical protein [Paraliomyxa miuraensis]|uniref:hypothetical protein n=1 Tax=Paraliomyxa miuraensis TaxID=376150 RepID=UPI00224FC8A1|nr:hypothetical protein [Paraliomyxa miuraensis]MCX4246224.1 hypothetical protein [Paraliomyxa miuraensis]
MPVRLPLPFAASVLCIAPRGRALGLAAVLLATACGQDDCEEPLTVCDIGSADCREHVFVQTACARGHEGRTVPTVYSITRDEFEALLRGGPEPTAEEQRVDAQLAAALRMLDLLPPGEGSSNEAAIQAYARNVLAFYSREDASVTIVETNLGSVDDETAVFILSHEFVHAQQDVDVGLQDFFDAHVSSSDSNTAIRSVTEGEAVLFSNVAMARQEGASITAGAFAEYYAATQQGLRDAAAGVGSDGVEAGYTDLSSSFPYPFGGELVTNRWLAEGTGAVLELYDDPPVSTAAILRTLAGHDPANVVDLPPLSATTPPEGWSIVAEDTLGAWILYVVALRSGFSEDSANALVEDWAGDHLLVAGGAAEAEVALAWSLRFGSDASAERFGEIGSVAPPEGVRSVVQNGHDVTLVMATDADTLALWETAFETATVASDDSFRTATRRAAPSLPRPVDDPRVPRRWIAQP